MMPFIVMLPKSTPVAKRFSTVTAIGILAGAAATTRSVGAFTYVPSKAGKNLPYNQISRISITDRHARSVSRLGGLGKRRGLP
ncbi:hypothetical protein BDV37DRAFT_265670, partial [Aspergillus pseudonomiae]